MPDIVLIAHGSPDPRHREGLETLAEAVRARVRPGRAVGVCYLDHHAPSPADLAVELGGSAVAVPILPNSQFAPDQVGSADLAVAIAVILRQLSVAALEAIPEHLGDIVDAPVRVGIEDK